MKKRLLTKITPLILTASFYCTSTLAFSSSPENNEDYRPADWTKSDSAEDDAKNAIAHNDLRLLGFAGRGSMIPGLDLTQIQDYSDKCGVRYFTEFSDVIREREQLEQMTRAKEYAVKYNKVILSSCTLSD